MHTSRALFYAAIKSLLAGITGVTFAIFFFNDENSTFPFIQICVLNAANGFLIFLFLLLFLFPLFVAERKKIMQTSVRTSFRNYLPILVLPLAGITGVFVLHVKNADEIRLLILVYLIFVIQFSIG
ncbi:MAG TPA: hypothetical protein VLB84_09665, partial [Bacteroidia bacterium]|nr:hypothetical protein [Bacteroidia bacterium]